MSSTTSVENILRPLAEALVAAVRDEKAAIPTVPRASQS